MFGRVSLVLACLCLAACATRSVRVVPPCATAGARLGVAWAALQRQLTIANGCDLASRVDCETLRLQIRRLSIDCPANTDVLMANAILAFEDHNLARAQQLLDELESNGTRSPDAAVMRARIALDQGNLQFALKYLRQQVRLLGDHAGLRETYASALFLNREWDAALVELDVAQKLGAPTWRVAYGQGLIAEEMGRFPEALQRYQEALTAKPGWREAESRLKALTVTRQSP